MNRRQRVGVIASVVWILGAGFYTLETRTRDAIRFGSQTTLSCEGFYDPGGPHYSVACDKDGADAMNLAVSEGRLEAAMIAFIPVPLGWGFVYLILFLIRWVKRGV